MSTKKEIEITGYAVKPITVGEPALLSGTDGSFTRTTDVLCINGISDKKITFETENSLYTLHYSNPHNTAGEMVKRMFAK